MTQTKAAFRRMLLAVFLLVLSISFADGAFAKKAHHPHHKPAETSSTTMEAQPAESAAPSEDSTQGTGQTVNTVEEAQTASTVRVNNLANLEALLNIIANGAEILAIMIGGPLCLGVPVGFVLLFFKGKRLIGLLLIVAGPMIVTAGLATPGFINFMVAAARDANLFS